MVYGIIHLGGMALIQCQKQRYYGHFVNQYI